MLFLIHNPSLFDYTNTQIELNTHCIKVESWDDENKKLE